MRKNKIGQTVRNIKIDCNSHIESIRKRMEVIPGITIDNFGLSAHLGKKFSPGCKACKRNKWTVVFIGRACNCKCYFCPQPYNKPAFGSTDDTNGIILTSTTKEYYLFLLMKLKNAAAAKNLEAIGYSGGEPFLYMDRIKHYAKEIMDIKSGLYQYIYTNGIAVTKDSVKELRDVGIEEVRFNLAATDFSDGVVKKMVYVRKIVPFLTIEVPSLRDTCLKIKKNLHKFIDIGVDQINLCEVNINQHNNLYFKNDPCYHVYPFSLKEVKEGSISRTTLIEQSPVWSRHITYDVMEMAAKEDWPITINDCSWLNHIKPTWVSL